MPERIYRELRGPHAFCSILNKIEDTLWDNLIMHEQKFQSYHLDKLVIDLEMWQYLDAFYS